MREVDDGDLAARQQRFLLLEGRHGLRSVSATSLSYIAPPDNTAPYHYDDAAISDRDCD